MRCAQTIGNSIHFIIVHHVILKDLTHTIHSEYMGGDQLHQINIPVTFILNSHNYQVSFNVCVQSVDFVCCGEQRCVLTGSGGERERTKIHIKWGSTCKYTCLIHMRILRDYFDKYERVLHLLMHLIQTIQEKTFDDLFQRCN